MIAYEPNFEQVKDEYLTKKVVPYYYDIAKFLGNKDYLLGNITY